MEYCGAGSVSDIIRLRNKTVSFFKNCITRIKIKLGIKTRSHNESQSSETRSWLMPRGISVPWPLREWARAVALIICPFICGVIISRSKCILKYGHLVSFLKITVLYKAKLCAASSPYLFHLTVLSAGHLVHVWFGNRHRIVLLPLSN